MQGHEATESPEVVRGRESFLRRAWGEAHAHLTTADREAPLAPEDLELLAAAAYLIGRDAESADVLARAHNEFLLRREAESAARCAFWLGFRSVVRGEIARGSGWLARARRVLEDSDCVDCVVQGYMRIPEAIQFVMQGQIEPAYSAFSDALAVGERFKDRSLVIVARHGQGRALLGMGRVAEGTALFDEIMVGITADEASPLVVGDVYCSVISACYDIFDFRRAREWTEVLHHWCSSQPDLVPHRGECLVRQAELERFHGGWSDAMDLVARACERLSDPPNQPAAGAAFYQQAELHRLRGNFAEAEALYRKANQLGRHPQPGLALLRLAQRRLDDAVGAIRQTVAEARGRTRRAIALVAAIEILLAANEVEEARAASDELTKIATELPAPFLRAAAAHGAGAVRLAEGDPRAAIALLRDAWSAWHELDAPYEAARARVLIALAHGELGDHDTAKMELDASRQLFERLGAATDLARVVELADTPAPKRTGVLTEREIQVLRLIATGKTNRAIATTLGISEKTVARHVSNIFLKLDLSSRAAATAYVFQHGLAGSAARST